MFVGMDVGGTRTRAAVYDNDGAVLGHGEAGPGNHLQESLETVIGNLTSAFNEALKAAGVESDSIQGLAAGMAGMGLGEATPAWFADLFGELGSFPNVAVWDAVTAHRGAIPDGVGVLIIAGTGSVVYARSNEGRQARVGGWGPDVPSDWGADQIAREAVAVACEAVDGRREASPLAEALAEKLGLPDVGAFVEATNSRKDLAALAETVGNLAEVDPIARDILARVTLRMTIALKAALKTVGMFDQMTIVSHAGSVFNAGRYILDPLEENIGLGDLQVQLMAPKHDPLYGAYLLARDLT